MVQCSTVTTQILGPCLNPKLRLLCVEFLCMLSSYVNLGLLVSSFLACIQLFPIPNTGFCFCLHPPLCVIWIFSVAPSELVCLVMFDFFQPPVSSEKWDTYGGSSASALLPLGLCSVALRSPNFTLCCEKERRRSNKMKKCTLKSNMSHWLTLMLFFYLLLSLFLMWIRTLVNRAEIRSKPLRCVSQVMSSSQWLSLIKAVCCEKWWMMTLNVCTIVIIFL